MEALPGRQLRETRFRVIDQASPVPRKEGEQCWDRPEEVA